MSQQYVEKQQLELPPRNLHRRSIPICPKCNQSCLREEGDFVRAFNNVYHYKCFICEDCQQPVADKYYPIIEEQSSKARNRKRLVLCEFDHMKRLGLICLKCNKPITTPEQKFHPQCIQCPSCVTPTISQYEFKGTSYCRIHYSLLPDTHCNGCDQAILKQFVEHRDIPDKIWHPECYMIFKFWGIKLAPVPPTQDTSKLVEIQIQVEEKVTRVWTDLSSFEESSANCISDMLLNVAAGAYMEGIRMANQFIMHLDVLFSALDTVGPHLHCDTEANLVCKQMIRFFQLLTVPSKSDIGITQELLSLVTGLAQNLKSLIRIGLSAALHLERDLGIQNAIPEFLNQLLELEKKRVWIAGRYWFKDPPTTAKMDTTAGQCNSCHLTIEETDCYGNDAQQLKWHPLCFHCSRCSVPLNEKSALLVDTTLYCQTCCTQQQQNEDTQTCTHVTLLQQYLFNLKLYLSKLSFSSSASSSSSSFIGAKKSPNEILMPETKRQRSILRMLGGHRSQPSRKPSINRLDSVQLGQVQCTTLQDASPHYSKKKNTNLMISTENTCHSPQSSPTTLSPTALSPVSAMPKTTNRLTTSIRRTFSTVSQTSGNNKQRLSLQGVFDKRREARRASILTLDNMGHPTTKTMYLSTLTQTQDFIVRHVAVITLHPLLNPNFTLDELIDLIEIKKPKKQIKKQTILVESQHHQHHHHHHNPASALWGKLITHIKTTNMHATNSTTTLNTTHTSEFKTFGVPLSTLLKKDRQQENGTKVGVTLRDLTPVIAASFSDHALIPAFVKSCIMAILQSDMSIEGVFRKNGNIRQLRTLANEIDNDNVENLERLLLKENSVQLASLLKRYLRELPEPLMTYPLYKVFVQCGKIEPLQERKRTLHLACCLLPKPNRDTMLLIFSTLKWVATFSDTNKMDIPNLARVIAPNVLYDKTSLAAPTTADVKKEAQDEINVIEILIREADQISIIPSDLILLSLQDNVDQDMSDLNSRYFIKHYIQLLADLRNRKSKSENNSPVSPSTKTLTQNTLLSKYHFGLPKSLNITTQSTPILTPSKQRRTSWIPSLTKK